MLKELLGLSFLACAEYKIIKYDEYVKVCKKPPYFLDFRPRRPWLLVSMERGICIGALLIAAFLGFRRFDAPMAIDRPRVDCFRVLGFRLDPALLLFLRFFWPLNYEFSN